jgi:hypothetical protein
MTNEARILAFLLLHNFEDDIDQEAAFLTYTPIAKIGATVVMKESRVNHASLAELNCFFSFSDTARVKRFLFRVK